MAIKKTVTIATIIFYLIFNLSCYSIRRVETKKTMVRLHEKSKTKRVFEVGKKNGEIIKFHKNQPGYFTDKGIAGEMLVVKKTEVVIDKKNLVGKKTFFSGLVSFRTKDGKTYEGKLVGEKNDKLFLSIMTKEWQTSVIPYNSIVYVKVKRFNIFKTGLLIGGICGVLYLITIILVADALDAMVEAFVLWE